MLKNEDYLNIFHEIKNSITLISGSLQLMEKKHPEVCNFNYWNEAMSEISFLKNMVIQLSSARLCSQLQLAPVNIYSFINQISSSIHAFSWNGFDCHITVEENLPPVELDPTLIKQAIINIVKNAYEAMGSSGTAEINVSSQNDMVQIAVTDHGGGLDPAYADSLFQPFVTSKTGGSGLGLVITRQIVETHKGTLSCDSRPGDGCTFTVSLPIRQN